MGLLNDILHPAQAIGTIISGLVRDFVPDPQKKLEILEQAQVQQAALQAKAMELDAALADAQQKVIVAEATGNSMQRNWRPITMYCFVAIIVNNFILAPYLKAFGLDVPLLEIPTQMWALLTVGIGGYIGARTYEKTKGVE